MVRLTELVKYGRKLDKNYFQTEIIKFPKITGSTSIQNQYPDSFQERKLASLVGMMSSYMIRKLFRDNEVGSHHTITRESRLTAEIVIDHLPKFVDDTKLALMGWAYNIENNGRKWIEHYNESPWKECIPDVFLLSQLDWSLQYGKLTRYREISRGEIKELEFYFTKILEWLRQEFADANQIVLRPELSLPNICEARPDIVIDDCIYVIKTVQRPQREIAKQKERLLGYSALAAFHRESPGDSSPELTKINSIGYIFPLSLLKHKVVLTDFTQEKQKFFISKLIELRQVTEDELLGASQFLKLGAATIPLTAERISTLRQELLVNRALRQVMVGKYNDAKSSLNDAIQATENRPFKTMRLLEEAIGVIERWNEFSSMGELYNNVDSILKQIDFKSQFWELLNLNQ